MRRIYLSRWHGRKKSKLFFLLFHLTKAGLPPFFETSDASLTSTSVSSACPCVSTVFFELTWLFLPRYRSGRRWMLEKCMRRVPGVPT